MNPILRYACASVAVLASLQGQESYKDRLDPIVEQGMREQKIPGLVVGIVQNGRLVYSKGFGVMKLGEPKPVTPETLFHVASITKPFVATSIVQLMEQGK